MLGHLGGVTALAMLLSLRSRPALVPVAWFVFTVVAVAVHFGGAVAGVLP
jgi:hypothetical protein